MALPVDYESSLDGHQQAELAIRTAIVDCFLAVAATPQFGFDATLAHPRLRYPDSTKTWELISSIIDPDTANANPAEQKRLLRYFAVSFYGQSRKLRELTLRYAMRISFGFKDVYSIDPSQNSTDQIVGCVMQFSKYLANNLNLGLDDRVEHQYLDTSALRFVLKDKQGNAVMIADNTLKVILEVC